MSHRFFVNKIFENKAEILGDDFSHIVNVLRLKTGDEIKIFNYEYGEYRAIINRIDKIKKTVWVEVKEKIKERERYDVKIIAIISLIKKEKWEFVLEKLTELGVDEIIPFLAKRSVVKIKDIESKKQRWEKIIYSAVKQCGRISTPKISDILENIDDLKLNDSTKKFFIWEKEEKNFLIDKINDLENVKEICFITGPEGGFEQEEEEKLINKNFLPVSLGDMVLRVETAIIATAAIFTQKFRRSKWKE